MVKFEKYTDGVDRATVHVTILLTREEVKDLEDTRKMLNKAMTGALGCEPTRFKSLKQYVEFKTRCYFAEMYEGRGTEEDY